MNHARIHVGLSVTVAMLALIAAGVGLIQTGRLEPRVVTTVHGVTFNLDGTGIYRHETVQGAATFRGTDVVTLVLCVPLLLWAALRWRPGNVRGSVWLSGLLSYFLYNAASLAFGAAYNELFLIYVAYFAVGLYAFGAVLAGIDLAALSRCTCTGVPRRGIAIFLATAGSVLLLVWMSDIVGAALTGEPPLGLLDNTTIVTYVIDLAITVPMSWAAAWLIWRRQPLGDLLSAVLLILYAIVGVVVVAQTVVNRMAGVELSLGQFIGFVASFMVLAVAAAAFANALLRRIAAAPEAGAWAA